MRMSWWNLQTLRPQLSPIRNLAGGRELKVTLTAIIGLLLPAPHCPLENPPSVKKQEAICSDPLCPRKKAHVIPLESRMLSVLSIVRFAMYLVAKVFGVHLAFRLLFTLQPLFLDS